MADPATSRQKQFLAQLGYQSEGQLSKQQASKLIDKLLADEKASGKTFPCPYCRKPFGPRPKREKKCPSCGNTIIHLSGRFYKESQADKLFQSEWLKESRKETKDEVTEEWKEEKKFRREYGEPMIVGYKVTVGDSCPQSKHLEGLLFYSSSKMFTTCRKCCRHLMNAGTIPANVSLHRSWPMTWIRVCESLNGATPKLRRSSRPARLPVSQ